MEQIQISNLEIEGEKGTFFTPHVSFNAETGVCLLEGESYLEDTWEFYERLQQWLKSFIQENRPIVFNFKLTYFNTSSSKGILDLLKTLKNYENKGGSVKVTWFYPEDDEDNLEEAEDFKEDTGLNIQFVAY
jgi:hypothetical protein